MKNLLCKVGFHNWFVERAIASYGNRCERCYRWQDKKQAQQVEQELRFIAENPNIPLNELVQILRKPS